MCRNGGCTGPKSCHTRSRVSAACTDPISDLFYIIFILLMDFYFIIFLSSVEQSRPKKEN